MTGLRDSIRTALAFSWVPMLAIIVASIVRGNLMAAIFMCLAMTLWLVRLGDIFNIFEL